MSAPRGGGANPAGVMRSLDQSLPLKLLRAREAVMERFRPHLHARGITEQQWRVLRALAEGGAVDAGTLARRVCLLTPSLSRILRDLGEEGLLRRVRDRNDGRLAIVSLTAKGQTLFRAMSRESEAIYAELQKLVGGTLYADVVGVLDRLVAALQPQADATGTGTRETMDA